MPRLVDEISFRNSARARGEFARIAEGLTPEVQHTIESYLASTADPDGATTALLGLRTAQPEAFARLVSTRAGVQYFIAVASYSRFLTTAILQNPEWLEAVVHAEDLHRVRRSDEFADRLEAFLPESPDPEAPQFALFRRKQILRILLRDVLGFGSLAEITEELSNLADAILGVAVRRMRAGLESRFGEPRTHAGAPAGFAVIALGKLGGCELNYSSDIDLMFVYSENGETAGEQPLSNKEFFKKLANLLTDLLSSYTPDGLCYRVDLRLRPEGTLGEACISADGARSYYQTRARDWELQMLIKARAAAGDIATGRALLDAAEQRIYSTTLDFTAVEQMSATRDRIDEKLAARRGAGCDVKLVRGGIRDIEFLVQCLQRLHGGRVAWLRHGGTLLALSRLHDKNLLSPTEYWRLASAYQFLRHLEHRLQFLDDRQTHSLPGESAELDLLARRMPVSHMAAETTGEGLLKQLQTHLDQVVEIYERIIHAQKPVYYTLAEEPPPGPELAFQHVPDLPPEQPGPRFGNLVRSLDETSPAFAAAIAQAPLHRGRRAFEHFLERASGCQDVLSFLETDATAATHLLDLFEHSPFFAEQLIREPRLVEQLHQQPANGMLPECSTATELRRLYRREMVRIMCQSVCERAPIFDTLGRTSDLADAVIQAAVRMALAGATHPSQDPSYRAADQLMVIALGRLGLREFDLASDADLVFVIPDADAAEQLFWTRVAERIVSILTVYTGEGMMFAVDTRLRPNGGAGPLVQTVTACREYFEKSAEAWEGISWMKARAVAGNAEAATRFLAEIQEVDWRRYGQSGRSRQDLRQMRTRLEKEQGAGNPLKAGRGGYYDIDFALMYLRLKGAGLFFKVLNTPERIDVIEKMGHLDRDDAAFLRDAAGFNRAVDHALRVYSGHAEGSLPAAEAKLRALEALVRRWTPDRLNDEPLPQKTATLQNRTRQLFDRLFA